MGTNATHVWLLSSLYVLLALFPPTEASTLPGAAQSGTSRQPHGRLSSPFPTPRGSLWYSPEDSDVLAVSHPCSGVGGCRRSYRAAAPSPFSLGGASLFCHLLQRKRKQKPEFIVYAEHVLASFLSPGWQAPRVLTKKAAMMTEHAEVQGGHHRLWGGQRGHMG